MRYARRQPIPTAERETGPLPILTMGLAVLALLGCSTCTARESSGAGNAASAEGSHGAAQPTKRSKTMDEGVSAPAAEHAAARERMLSEQLRARDISDERVLAAMRSVPRHEFVLPGFADLAYADRPLPIVGDQTISQPYIVAFMTQAADIAPGERCLEIGTGSGYQAAVLAEICEQTYSIEYLPEVAEFGKDNLKRTGYLSRNVQLRVGDGYSGWPDAAPFDAILVTAAPEEVPAPLLDQLAVGGRLVIPVGPEHGMQRLEVWTRNEPGADRSNFTSKTLSGVRFVPFLGPGGK